MKVLVTGSKGFIGRHLISELKNLNIAFIEVDDSIDLCKANSLSKIEPVDVVFHLAAKTFIPESFENPASFFENNFLSTLNVLEYCKTHNARIITPSTYVYGQPEYLPVDENHPINPSSPYTTSKLISESLIKSYSRDFGVDGIILRLFNVYGANTNDHFLIPKIIKQAIEHQAVNLFDPRPRRDFVYVTDVVDAFIKSASIPLEGIEIINIGSGKSNSINDIISVVENNLQLPFSVTYSGESRKNDVMETVADINKAKNLLGWAPQVELNEGINKIIANDYTR